MAAFSLPRGISCGGCIAGPRMGPKTGLSLHIGSICRVPTLCNRYQHSKEEGIVLSRNSQKNVGDVNDDLHPVAGLQLTAR